MKKVFIRDENNKIIGTQIKLEKKEWLDAIIYLEHQLNLCENAIILINHSLEEKMTKKRKIYFLNRIKEYELKKQNILNDLERINGIKTYDSFKETELGVQSRETLDFKPVMTKEQKEKQKSLNKIYNIKRNKEKMPIITLS